MAIAAPGQLNLDEPPSWGSRSVDVFEKLEQIGEGTYGQVYMAKEKATGEIVALKKVRMDNEKEGFPITAIREIKILKKLKHPNVINLKEIVTIYMVFEYMDHDLTGLSDRPGMRFTIPQIKCYMRQLLQGLHYCHKNQVLHRDIKGSNLLIDNNGILKLADFGLARMFNVDSNVQLTNRVITLWYRPPELLLGATKYSPAVDMWSVGCIFAELLHGKAVLPGKNEIEQLNLIYQLCGSPEETNWPGVSKLSWFHQFKPERPFKRRVKDVFKHFDMHALDLVEKMLTLDPEKRITAEEALDAEYFWTAPLPCEPSSLPKYEASHEYQTKKKRQHQRQQAEEAKRQKPSGSSQQPHSLPAHNRLPPLQGGGGIAPPRGTSSQPYGPPPSHHQGGSRHMGGSYQQGGRPPPSHAGGGGFGGRGAGGGAYPPGGGRYGGGQMAPPPGPGGGAYGAYSGAGYAGGGRGLGGGRGGAAPYGLPHTLTLTGSTMHGLVTSRHHQPTPTREDKAPLHTIGITGSDSGGEGFYVCLSIACSSVW
eukprot:jgi/Mesen1/6793/ME000035S06176